MNKPHFKKIAFIIEKFNVSLLFKRFGIPLFIGCWPLLYLIRDVIPIDGEYISIGNDFNHLYYKYKVYLLSHLSEMSVPLWSPSEASGYPMFSNPFAQIFYPLNLILVLWFKMMGGYSYLDHQIFTIFGISIFALGLYFWLRELNANVRAVLLAVLIVSVSFKVTEIIRFPNAVHSVAWYPWILFSLTKIMFGQSVKHIIPACLLFVFSIFSLCTAGYPYFVYYFQFLILPYGFVFVIRPLRHQLIGHPRIRWKQALFCTGISGFIAALVSAPYLLLIKNLMSETVDRGGKNFFYSVQHVFNLEDTIGSLIYPPFSQTEGWYFFSISGLLLILLFLFYRRDTETAGSVPNTSGSMAYSKLYLTGWFVFISYMSYGKDSYLFKFFWHFLPGFSSMRVWGRLNIVLLPILAWIISISYAHFECIAFSNRNSTEKEMKNRNIKPWIFISSAYFIVFSGQSYLYAHNYFDPYWFRHFKNFHGFEPLFIYLGLISYLVISLTLLFGKKLFKNGKAICLTLMVFVAAMEMWPVGANTWVEVKKRKVEPRTSLNMSEINNSSFAYPRKFDQNTITLSPAFNAGLIPNWYFARYVDFLKRTYSETSARQTLLGETNNPKRLFFSESVHYNTIHMFLKDCTRFEETGALVSYDGDELVWDIDSPIDGYLSFIDNWDPFWSAYVDGRQTKIDLLFGTFKAVFIKKGRHRIIFRYEPTLKKSMRYSFEKRE